MVIVIGVVKANEKFLHFSPGRKAGGGNDQPEDLQGNGGGKVGCKSANQVPHSDESLQRLC